MAKTLSQRIADRLEFLVKPIGVAEVSARSTVTKSYIYRLLKGVEQNPSIDRLNLIAEACGTNLAYFFEPWKSPQQDEQLAKQQDERARQLLESALANENFRPIILTILESFSPPAAPKRSAGKGGPGKAGRR